MRLNVSAAATGTGRRDEYAKRTCRQAVNSKTHDVVAAVKAAGLSTDEGPGRSPVFAPAKAP